MKPSFGIKKFKDTFKNAYHTRSKIWQMANLQKTKHRKTHNFNKYRQKIATRLNKINRKSFTVSKKIRHNSKNFTNNILNKLLIRPTSLVELLFKLGLHKYALSLKLIFILASFLALLIMDNFVISFIMTTADVFCIALIFSFTTTSKDEAIIGGKFDYGMYKKIKAEKNIIAIIIAFLATMLFIIAGHCYIANIIRL